jgi:molybdate transport system regulatory protein
MAHLSIRIDFEPSGSALGPGMAQLLERIGKMGSIRKAAASMDMSYRKAWLLVKGMHDTFGGPVVTTEIGGAAGGGAALTDLGEKLIKTFRDIEKNAEKATAAEMAELSQMVQKNAPSRGSIGTKGVKK